jgi:hypothetical protein
MRNIFALAFGFILAVILSSCVASTPDPITITEVVHQTVEAPTEFVQITATQMPVPTKTNIPPTPTFPAPEGADLPDSAVRGVNEQGREVILDQPGGEVLWTLIEDENGSLAWQKALSEEQEALLAEAQANFDAKALGHNDERYNLDFVVMDDDTVIAKTPFDAEGASHYMYHQEVGEWEDQHPGRNAVESQYYDGEKASVWEYLGQFEPEWDQQTLSYKTQAFRDPETGFWLPADQAPSGVELETMGQREIVG